MLRVLLCLLALTCGGALAREQFIVGGEVVTLPTKWPWQGSLKTSSGSHTCGCVLIHADWVLTAAHCVGGTGYSMEFGTVFLNQGQLVAVEEYVVHPEYEVGTGAYPNDIAILKPATSIVEGSSVQPILMSNGADVTNEVCYISGWGRLSGGGTLPNQLYDVEIPVITNQECEAIWGNNYNQNAHICVYDSDTPDKGACNGDSGGPLMCNVNAQYRLEGLASWVAGGCDTTYPCAYARVYSYVGWVCSETDGAVCP